MLDSIVFQNKWSAKARFTVKALISVAVIALSVILPQLVHFAFGAPGGVQLLPMYLPVLVGGCLLGYKAGIIVGILSPLASFLITTLFGNPMPNASRLPYMVVELAVFAAVSGAFSKLCLKNKWFAFVAVIAAEILGRSVFLAITALFESVGGLSLSLVWSQVQTGFIGLGIQAILAPSIIIFLRELIVKNK